MKIILGTRKPQTSAWLYFVGTLCCVAIWIQFEPRKKETFCCENHNYLSNYLYDDNNFSEFEKTSLSNRYFTNEVCLLFIVGIIKPRLI